MCCECAHPNVCATRLPQEEHEQFIFFPSNEYPHEKTGFMVHDANDRVNNKTIHYRQWAF